MNGRSGLTMFFLFLLLAVMILFQVLSMIQADRLYERLNTLIDRWQSDAPVRTTAQNNPDAPSPDQYPGDEGDWLVWSLPGEPATLNEIHESSTMATRWIVSGNINEALLEHDPDELNLRPLLAERFEISDDGLDVYFKIRGDVHFSDGKPVTADDVIFSYNTIVDPNVDSASLANYYRDVDRVEKISDLEVKFYMKQVYFKSLEFLGSMPILPKHVYQYKTAAEFNNRISDPVGTGPYIFERWDVGRQVVLRRNENYWGKKPKIAKIVYKFITNDTAAVQSLRSHDVDFLRPLPDQFTELSADPDFTKDFYCLSYWHPAVGYFWIGWNQDRPFFKDKLVRRAMTCMIDRELFCKHLLKNPDVLVPTGTFYMFGPQSDPDIKPWPYDPEKANRLLDEAGWIDTDGDGIRDKDGVPFRFKYQIVAGTYLHEQIAKLVKDSAAKAGIEVTIDPYEWSVFIQRVQDRQFDAVNMAWMGGLEQDPYQIWHSSQIKGGSNYVGFNNPEADALIEEARRTLDDNKRNEMYHRFHAILHDEQPYTFVYTRPEQQVLDNRFKNVIVHKLGLDTREWYVPQDEQRYK